MFSTYIHIHFPTAAVVGRHLLTQDRVEDYVLLAKGNATRRIQRFEATVTLKATWQRVAGIDRVESAHRPPLDINSSSNSSSR